MEKEIVKVVEEDMDASDSDREFHLLMAKSSVYRVLEFFTDFLWEEEQNSLMWIKLIELMKEKKSHSVVLDNHRDLLYATRYKDSVQAQKIMRNHLNHPCDIYFDIIGDGEA